MTPLVGFMNTRILYVQLITDLTESLTPDSVNVMWSSQLFRDECPLKEEWFGTPYSSEGYFPESHFSCQNYTPGCFFLQIYLPRGKMHGRVCMIYVEDQCIVVMLQILKFLTICTYHHLIPSLVGNSSISPSITMYLSLSLSLSLSLQPLATDFTIKQPPPEPHKVTPTSM